MRAEPSAAIEIDMRRWRTISIVGKPHLRGAVRRMKIVRERARR
jgi:hypothetical protein